MMAQDFDYPGLQKSLAAAAAEGIHLGTSSWKYPGWLGTVYDEQRYLHHGKVSTSRFEKTCLTEYADLFSTVCVDAAYYRFPDTDSLAALAAQVPPQFRFSFKVTADITVKRFPHLPRYGQKGGTLNPHFLDPDLFISAFLAPCETILSNIGIIIFEFSPFHPGDFDRGRDFMAALDQFLSALPAGRDYGVEIRNPTFLHPDYFAMLASHGVTHVYNSWAAMPSLTEQWELPGSRTSDSCLAARLLLKPGRKYQEAVDTFQPYDRVREIQPEVRTTAAALIRHARKSRTRTYLYVNNRLEGNAPRTLAAVMAMAGEA